MSVRALSTAWGQSRAKASELLVLLALADQADDSGLAWPSEESIAGRARITERQVRRCIEQLEERGELEVWTYTRAGETFTRNAYRVLVGEFAAFKGSDPRGLEERGKASGAKLRIPPAVRRHVLERDGYRCVYCGTTERLSIDHMIPRSRGGSDEFSNLQTLCVPCNSSKGTATDEEARATGQLVRRPPVANVRRAPDTHVRYARAALDFDLEPPVEPSVALSKESARSELDGMYQALVKECYPPNAVLTVREKRQVALAARNILSAGATPDMVSKVRRAYQAHTSYSKCALTAQALSSRWAELAPTATSPSCDACGLTGGRHAADCEKIAA